MIFGVYMMRDEAADLFLQLTQDMNDATAMRNFEQAMSNKNSVMNFRPGDFSLWKIGEFDNQSGVLKAVPATKLMHGGQKDDTV